MSITYGFPYRSQETPFEYRPQSGLQYPAVARALKYEIFAQESFTIQPRSISIIALKFGVMIRLGIVLAALKHELKVKRLSMQNEAIAETTSDIIVTIQNNSDVPVTVNAGDSLCYVGYASSAIN